MNENKVAEQTRPINLWHTAKGKVVTCRLPDDVHDLLLRQASNQGMTKGAYLKTIITKSLRRRTPSDCKT